MKYSDIHPDENFARNMRTTPWTKLFPHWWSEDDLTRAIGDEVERIKAQMIFALLNMGIKPPVMIWQSSIDYREHVVDENITSFPSTIEIDPPLYKTWGKIKIVNNGEDDIYDLKIMFDDVNGVTITNTIAPNDEVILDLEKQQFSINNRLIEPYQHGEGIPYFITSQYTIETKENMKTIPLHNETLNITFDADNSYDVDLDVNISLKNAVFINEQNIEITSIELLPIDRVDLYVNYDFKFRPNQSGWKMAYTKEYDKNTNVIYDMITTHFHTKEFYVEVFFRELEYPYRVGFPCYKDADEDSIYHVNNRLDTWGKYLGLPRRDYRTEIDEEDYPYTFPIYYPFDIEQDFWYYSRLINEYCWNEEAIDSVDLIDTDGHGIMRLHSIDPFVQDFVVHAKTIKPTSRENVNYNFYIPTVITEQSQNVTIDDYDDEDIKYIDVHPHRGGDYNQVSFVDTENLLDYNDNYSMITLYNKTGQHISYELYKSKELDLFFNLANLPPNINIEGFEFTIDAESTDNLLDKYNDERTRVELRSFGETIFAKSVGESGTYGLERENIIYGGKDILFDFDEKIINKKIGDVHVSQKFTIEPFSGTYGEYIEIPFILRENDEEVEELKNISIIYDNNEIVIADYITEQRSYPDKNTNETITEDVKLLRAYIPDTIEGKQLTIQSLKSDTHYPFSVTIDIEKSIESNVSDNSHEPVNTIEGPIINNHINTFTHTDDWDTGDLRDILQKSGLHFIYTLQNDNDTNNPTFIIHNITLKIYYSPKKTQFDLQTYITQDVIDDFIIGDLIINIENTGPIPFASKIDIFNEQNISLSTNSINVDLNPQDKAQHIVHIQQQPPFVDGAYDIITMCEKVKRQNTILIDTGGLIQTTTKVKPIFTQYHSETTFEASVNTTSRDTINEGLMEFYINKILVDTVEVINGVATSTKFIHDLDIGTGFYNFEAKYIGSEKYAPSRASSVILISKQNVEMRITSDKQSTLNKPYVCEAIVTSNGAPVTEGNVTFYLDNEEIGRPDVDENGVASLTHIFTNKNPCSYTLKAVYNGTITYGHEEVTKDIILSGGDTELIVYNIVGAPTETITLSAKVIQKMCAKAKYNNVSIGDITVKILDGDTVLHTVTKTVNDEGRISAQWTIPKNITVKDYTISCSYSESDNSFNPSNGTGVLSVQRKNVQLKHQTLFYASRYEPLGFYIQVRDENNVPVTDGQVSITIPSLNITITTDIDSDGGARLIRNAIDFTHEEWSELDHLTFKRGENGKTFYYQGALETEVPENLYRIYDNQYHDLQYVNFEIRNGNLYYIRQSKSDEQVYIGDDGYLYTRTNIDDINLNQKQYVIGMHDITIKYIGHPKYNSTTNKSKIKITTPDVDADLHSYHVKYNADDIIECFITEYDWTKNKNMPINDKGYVYFYIDNEFLGKVQVIQGRAILPQEVLNDITANNHLLSAEYVPKTKGKAHTFTYSLLNIEQIISTINYQTNRMLRGKDTHFTFSITLPGYEQMQNSGHIYGNVNIYLNDEFINNYYLFGNENGKFESTITIPEDVSENDYELLITYEGTSFIKASELRIPLQHTVLPVTIGNYSIQTIANEKCNIDIAVHADDNDDISEGQIALYYDDEMVTSANVIHNRAYLSFNIGDVEIGHYQYIIKYKNGVNYTNGSNNALLHVNVINPLDKIYIASYGNDEQGNGSKTQPFKTLEQSIRCLNDNGEIYILDNVSITQSIEINKNINIDGDNGCAITKDLVDLFNDGLDYNNLHVYNMSKFTEDLLEIKDLKIENLNINEFSIIDRELYFLRGNDLIPVYLYDNGKFYAKTQLTIEDINKNYTITSNKKLNINNIIFKSNDNDVVNDFTLINYGTLQITHSIIQPNISIHNYKKLTMNRNIIYGVINHGALYNLDNNWWGQNKSPYNTNNNIILNIKANIEPPVLGEDFHVILEMIGENGRYYEIPQLEFVLTADTGYFQTPTGFFHNQQHDTLYVDAVQEGKIYATVDNEQVEMDVYNYDRKTEIILDEMHDIPIGHQISFKAKVQSCADTFYQFDKDNNIINQSNSINNGKVIFYLDDVQIGQSYVKNGLAEILIFFSENQYNINTEYEISAKYVPNDYYFDSYNKKSIQLISESNVCYIDPNGDNNNDGTFDRPLQTITAGILSNKRTIYLKDGYYSDNNIIINHSVNIKKYNNYAIFTKNNSNAIFNINDSNDISVKLDGLDFINNNCNTIINNMGKLEINECVFYKNDVNQVIDSGHSKSLKIYRSAIVDNSKFINDGSKINTLQYCWFGTNNPNKDAHIFNYTINDYVIMDVKTSKDIIYIGTIARITSTLLHYQHNDDVYILNEKLPLRVSIFESDSGLLMPLKDYTYNNQSTSLFNSNEISNSEKIVLSLPDNTNYIDKELVLKCNVNNAIGNNIEYGNVIFTIYYDNKIYVRGASVIDGVATLSLPYLRLKVDNYKLTCDYQYDTENYTVSGDFDVKRPDIIINDCQLHNITLESMQIYIDDIKDIFGQKVYEQKVNIYLDDVLTQTINEQDYIKNGILSAFITYPMVDAGYHKITITTEDIVSDYDVLIYEKDCYIDKYTTHIDFNYDKIQKDYTFDLKFNILDSNNNFVINGLVDVYFNDNLIGNKLEIDNGYCIIPDFQITERGHHSFFINYYGDKYHYYDCSYINNNINVDLFEVIIDSEELQKQLVIDSYSDLDLRFQIKDIFDNPINDGYVNIYIDGLKLNEDDLTFNNNYIDTTFQLPPNTAVGRHDCTIEYFDTTNTYVNTTLDTYLYVTQIPVNIIIDSISAVTDSDINVPYDIQSPYGSITTGMLTAYINGEQIGSTSVANTSTKTITLHIPKIIANNNYDIIFKYTDSMGYYKECTQSVYSIIKPKKINITTSHQWYYPNKEFNFIITMQDDDNNYIDSGDVTIYIDNVKESDTQEVNYGESVFSLYFNKVEKYNLSVVYNDDSYYYQEEPYKQTLTISPILIEGITFKKPLVSVANTEYNNTFIFNAFEDYEVNDGIIDIFLNDEKKGTYYINRNKEFKIDIGDLKSGTYDLFIKYHDSELFDDYEKTFDFTIEERSLNMSINNGQNIVASLKERINIPVHLNEPTDGIIKYYLGVNEENMKFIGVAQINGSDTSYSYTLPKTLDEKPSNQNYYLIKAVFENNGKYQECTSYCNLDIQLTTPVLHLQPITAYYHSTIKAKVTNNIEDDAPIDFYIDNEYIDTVMSNNGICTFDYTLPRKYIAGEYTLTAKYNKTSVMNESSVDATLTVTPSPVYIQSKNIESYIGDTITINVVGVDTEDRIINEGTMSFSINNTSITYNDNDTFYMNDQVQYQLPMNIINNTTIKAQYHSTDTTKYKNTTTNISLSLLKHILNIDILKLKKCTRGDNINLDVVLSSETIDTIDVNFNATLSSPEYTKNKTNNHYNNEIKTLSFYIDTRFGDYSTYNLTIAIPENNIFESKEELFKAPIQNRNNIYVDSSVESLNHTGTEDDPVGTLEEAINLVANNGNITILSNNIKDDNITVDKDINILNNQQVSTHATFNVEKSLSLNNFVFSNYDNTTTNDEEEEIIEDAIFNNNGELIITNCIFNNNKAQCIMNNNILKADNIVFNNNQSTISGTCIDIEKNNQHTTITNCLFNGNSAKYKGGCINSYKGNDVYIKGNHFGKNNSVNGDGVYISTYGNMNIVDNIFYQCENSAINVLGGEVQIELNVFHSQIDTVINNINGTVTANMNYWGNNKLQNIEYKWIGNVILDTWLLADYELHSSNINTSDYIIAHINKYANRQEAETYEFIFNNFIHHNVDVSLHINNIKVQDSYIDKEIDMNYHNGDSIIIKIFGNDIEVEL